MYCSFFKSILDRFLALVLLIFFVPLMIIVSIFVYVSIGRPILFRQVRPGRDEVLYTIYKFRSMNDNDQLEDHERLAGFGKILRSTSLDELPQLFNVLKGDMSFIGPRPLLLEYLPLYNDTQKKRHSVKPGITGWAQVNGRNAISWQKKFELDVWYVKHCSFWLDVKIFLLTILKLIKRSDISSKNHISMEKFKGNE